MRETGPAAAGERADEVVIGLSPAFGREIWVALNGMTVGEVLRQLLAGIEEEGLASRLVRVRRSIDLGAIGWAAARISGSGVSVGLQAKGTALIHRADLPPLANVELFSIAPRITSALYRNLGRNAARYAKGLTPEPLLLPESSEPLGPRYHARVVRSSRSSDGSWRTRSPSSWRRRGRAELSAGGRRRAGRALGDREAGRRDHARCGRLRASAAPATLRSPPRPCASRPASPNAAATRSSPRTSVGRPSSSRLTTTSCSRFYEMLRPGRSSASELDSLAAALEARAAVLCAALVREARAAYVRRGVARPE